MNTCIEIRDSPIHGKGVFAVRDISNGEIIEESHVIPLLKDIELPEELAVLQYPWNTEQYGLCISGTGSLFNHSDNANAMIHSVDEQKCVQRYSATRNILKDEEVTIYYHQEFEDHVNGCMGDG